MCRRTSISRYGCRHTRCTATRRVHSRLPANASLRKVSSERLRAARRVKQAEVCNQSFHGEASAMHRHVLRQIVVSFDFMFAAQVQPSKCE